jgi:hypothetical protein
VQIIINLKIKFQHIKAHRNKMFVFLLLTYFASFFSSFLIDTAFDFNKNIEEFNEFKDHYKNSSELYDLVEILTSEEEKENKEQSNAFFDISENYQRLYSNLNSFQFDLPQKKQFSHLNKTPKYLLFHQLKIYSES